MSLIFGLSIATGAAAFDTSSRDCWFTEFAEWCVACGVDPEEVFRMLRLESGK
jgi:hypothetical protein